MPRVKIGPAPPDIKTLDIEIVRLRDLDVRGLQIRWHNAFGRRAPLHLPRHLLFRVLAYRLQADCLGTWMPKANGSLMEQEQPRMPASARWTCNA